MHLIELVFNVLMERSNIFKLNTEFHGFPPQKVPYFTFFRTSFHRWSIKNGLCSSYWLVWDVCLREPQDFTKERPYQCKKPLRKKLEDYRNDSFSAPTFQNLCPRFGRLLPKILWSYSIRGSLDNTFQETKHPKRKDLSYKKCASSIWIFFETRNEIKLFKK